MYSARVAFEREGDHAGRALVPRGRDGEQTGVASSFPPSLVASGLDSSSSIFAQHLGIPTSSPAGAVSSCSSFPLSATDSFELIGNLLYP